MPPLKVDKHRLAKLLDTVVVSTRDFNVEKLEKLYSMFSQCIYQYRNDFDKSQMIQVRCQVVLDVTLHVIIYWYRNCNDLFIPCHTS